MRIVLPFRQMIPTYLYLIIKMIKTTYYFSLFFLISTISFFLSGCGDDHTAAKQNHYRILINSNEGLYTVDPRNPDTLELLASNNGQQSNAFIYSEFNTSGGENREFLSKGLFIKENKFFRIELDTELPIVPIQVSNIANANEICSFYQTQTNQDIVYLNDMVLGIELPGEDGECYISTVNSDLSISITPSLDNVRATINLAMTATDEPIVTGTQPHYSYGQATPLYRNSLISPSTGERIRGLLAIENNNLYWYPDETQTNRVLLLESVTKIFQLGTAWKKSFNIEYSVLQIDNKIFAFSESTSILLELLTLSGTDYPYPLSTAIKYNSNIPSLTTFVLDKGQLIEIKINQKGIIDAQQLALSGITLAQDAYFYYSSNNDFLLVNNAGEFLKISIANQNSTLLAPSGYELIRAYSDHALVSSIDSAVFINWEGDEILRFDNTSIAYSTVSGIRNHDLYLFSTQSNGVSTNFSLFDAKNIYQRYNLGTTAFPIEAQWMASVIITQDGLAVWSIQTYSNISASYIFISDINNPGELVDAFPDLTNKRIIN